MFHIFHIAVGPKSSPKQPKRSKTCLFCWSSFYRCHLPFISLKNCKNAPWRASSFSVRHLEISTIWWDLQGGTLNLPSLLVPYNTPDVRCRLFPAFDWGQSINYSSEKNTSNVTSIESSERIWTTFNQSALQHCIAWGLRHPSHGLQSYIQSTAVWVAWQSTEKIYCTYWSPPPVTGGIGKLINQIAKIQKLIIWSCFVPSLFEAFKYFNSFQYKNFI